jgi:hypothetical protein
MRKLATVLALAFGAVSAHAAVACEDRVQTAQQPEQKPAIAAKTRKQVKQQKKKAERTGKTAVARADR